MDPTSKGYKLTTDLGEYQQLDEAVRSALTAALGDHPFLRPRCTLPGQLEIHIGLGTVQRTETRHSGDQSTARVDIYLFETDAFETQPIGSRGVSVKYGVLQPNLPKVFRHELGHFIDARLDREFGYSEAIRPTDPSSLQIYHSIWCSYIDGRLGDLAPHNLKFRQKEAAQFAVAPEIIVRAWNGEFDDYSTIVDLTKKIAAASLGSVDS
jgi:hypothetical protein